MAYGESLGNTFRLPGKFIQPQQPQQITQGIEYSGMSPLDDPQHPLAQRDEMLSNLYDTYASLDSYAKEAAKNGIDVFEPDFTQRGGGEAHRTFQMLQGALMKQANALRMEQEREKQISPLVAQGKVRFNKGVDMQGLAYSDPNNYYSTEPLENVNEANMRARSATYTQPDQDRVNAELQAEMDQIDNDPTLSPDAKALQKSYIVKNARETNPAYFRADAGDGGSGAAAKTLIPLYERITNLTRGVFPESETKPVVHNGKMYSGSSSLAGDNYGEIQVKKTDSNGNEIWVKQPRVIKNILKDKEGNTFLQFDGESELINVSNKPSDEVMRTIVESNSSKYGGANALPMFYNELSKKGILGNDRSVDPDVVFGKDLDKQEVKTRPVLPGQERLLQQIEDGFKNLQKNGGEFPIVSRKGKLVFERDSEKGISLKNYKDLGFNKPITNLDYAKFVKLLEDAGTYESILANVGKTRDSNGNVVDAKGKTFTSTQSKAIEAFTKKFGRKPSSSEEQKILLKFK